ncbi:MAG: NAD(P)H-hydrate dehydratase [Ruminococcaceae bacterium]|nr:NAD(P)H-hydrate dehydratase [Oscillospiraceae bacterium]
MTTITADFVSSCLPKRPHDAHKGTMGTMLNISGSYAMAGACILSSMSALKSGVGLLKVALPHSIYQIVASSVFEAVFVPVSESEKGTVDVNSLDFLLDISKSAQSILLGCGLKFCEETIDFTKKFVTACTTPLLVDADGINALSQNINVLKDTSAPVVLTPHIKEMSRLCKKSVEYIISHKSEVAENFAKEYQCVVVLKGKDTIVTDGDNTFVNPTGNSGMAKGGSGDVLSGIIASLMAQGVPPLESACASVYIHGLAGDMASKKLSKTSMLPRDIVGFLPDVFKSIESK